MTIDRRRILAMAAVSFVPAAPRTAGKAGRGGVGETLHGQTQELLDAITFGGAETWRKYLHDDFVLTSEDGEVVFKSALAGQIKPLAAGVSGHIRAIDFQARVHGATAIATYVSDEDESYHGHALHCQYRSTDTWIETPAGWRLLASQVLALRTDPPAIALAAAKADEYCGRYSLSSDVLFEIRRKGEGLEGQQTGRPWHDIKAEAPDVLFSPGRPRYRSIFHRDAAGRITGFAERREAWDLEWKKV